VGQADAAPAAGDFPKALRVDHHAAMNIGPVELSILVALVLLVFVLLVYRAAVRSAPRDPGVPVELYGEEVILRTYRTHRPDDAIRWYQRDLDDLVDHGYLPTGHSWAPGEWTFAPFLVGILLAPFGIGVVLLAYLAILRPDGTLTATFVLRDLARASVPHLPDRPTASTSHR
jgi:hypothetical protein